MTCYICQVGALSKAEDILEWNMGLVLATARILFQCKISRCAIFFLANWPFSMTYGLRTPFLACNSVNTYMYFTYVYHKRYNIYTHLSFAQISESHSHLQVICSMFSLRNS